MKTSGSGLKQDNWPTPRIVGGKKRQFRWGGLASLNENSTGFFKTFKTKKTGFRLIWLNFGLYWILSIFFFAFSTFPVFSQTGGHCPSQASPDLPITENTYQYWSTANNAPVSVGPRLASLTYYWKRDVWFQLPYGYLNPWSITNRTSVQSLEEYISAIAKNSRYTGYDSSTGLFNPDLLEREANSPTFSFWMPSLRYVESNMMTMRGPSGFFWPCEAGRESPSEDEYMVQFRIEWPGLEGSESSQAARRFLGASFRHISPNPSSVKFSSDELDVALRCTSGRGCDGWVWHKEKDLILYIHFPESLREIDLEEFWRAPVDASVQLVESWKLNEEPVNEY